MESVSQEFSVREDRVDAGSSTAERGCDSPFIDVEAANDSLLTQLARTIEYEIIPRLMLAHRANHVVAARPDEAAQAFSSDEVAVFATLSMSEDEDQALEAIADLRALDVPVEHIYTDLLAPAARHLGELWTEDLCSFTDVTVGLGRLQRVLRELSPMMGRGASSRRDERRILLLPCPGEQHTFGLLMVGEFFRTAGWDVSGGACATGTDALSLVASESFDVVGFSLGAEVHVAALASTIAAVRHATCNRRLVVLVGGPLFANEPDLVGRVGADGMTIDGREAPSLAERLVSGAVKAHQIHG